MFQRQHFWNKMPNRGCMIVWYIRMHVLYCHYILVHFKISTSNESTNLTHCGSHLRIFLSITDIWFSCLSSFLPMFVVSLRCLVVGARFANVAVEIWIFWNWNWVYVSHDVSNADVKFNYMNWIWYYVMISDGFTIWFWTWNFNFTHLYDDHMNRSFSAHARYFI